QLFDQTELIYEDRFLVTLYPAVAPVIHSFPADQSLTWYDSLVLSWELFDHVPASWSILINGSLTASGTWEIPSYQLHWSIPILDEGRYNVTLAAYDRTGHQTSRTTWLTVVSPRPPVIATCPYLTEIQWGEENASLSWEVHGGTHWTLWKNGTAVDGGEVTSTRIDVQIENWEQEDWRPGLYKLTLQVTEDGVVAVTCTSWLKVLVNFGDAFADLIITEASRWYSNGDHALGPPDGNYSHLYLDYGNGHVTLDMGPGEEILDGKGVDFTVYAQEGEYAVFVGNNLSAPILVGNQMTTPLTLLGTGVGNTSFDLANVSLEKARYIQIVYLAGEKVELDAVVATHFNYPPQPPNPTRWKIFVFGSLIALGAILGLWVRRRKTLLARINKIYHVLFCGLIAIFFLSRAFLWRPQPPTREYDIWHLFEWVKTLNSGSNLYAVLEPDGTPTKSISSLPLYILIGQIPMILGFSTYYEWTNVMRLLHVVAELGIGLLLYKLALERRRPALGLLGAAIWFFNAITIFVWQDQQLDAITICFAIWAIYIADRKPNLAGFLLGCSIGINLITLLLVPLFVLLRIRDGRADQRTVRDQFSVVLHSLLVIALVPLAISLPFLLWDYQSFLRGIVAHGIRNTAAHTSTQFAGTFHEIIIHEIPIIQINLSEFFSKHTINLIFLRAPLMLTLLGLYIVYWRKVVDKYLATSFVFAIYLYFSPVVFIHNLIWPIAMILAAIISRVYMIPNNPIDPNPSQKTLKQRIEMEDGSWTLLFVFILLFAGILRYYYLTVVMEQPFSLQAFAGMVSDLGIGIIIYQVARENNRFLLGVFGATFWLFNQGTLHIFGLKSNISIGLFFAVLGLYLLKAQPDLAKLFLGISIVYSPLMLIFTIIFLIGPGSRSKLFENLKKRNGNYLQLKQVLKSVVLLLIIPVGLFPIVKTDYKVLFKYFSTRSPYYFLGMSLPIAFMYHSLMWIGLLGVCYLHRNELDRFAYATLAAVLFYTFAIHIYVYIPFFWVLFVILYAVGGHFTLNSYLPDSKTGSKALSSE
ncbi:MAG: hypothetical protein ACFFCW_10225, partial [Candidatus Hodarchaeota archaeon]